MRIKKQTELEQLIKVELLGIITRIAELAAKNIIDANQQEFINSLKSVINHQIAFAWEVTKLLNDLDKKTPQDARDLGEVEAIIVTDNEDNVIAVVDSERIIEHEGYKVTIDKKFKEGMSKEEANIQILHNADGRKALMINGVEIPCVKKVCYDERPSEVSTVTSEIIPTTFASDRSSVCTVNLSNKKDQ